MILSSCGCKVSWALRGDAAPAGASLACVCYPHSKPGVSGILASASNPAGHGSENPPDSPEPSSPNLRIFRWGRWCDTRVQLCAGNASKCRNFRPHAAGFTMIFTSAGLPTDWRSGSSSRMYPCPSSSSSVGKISSVFLKNFPRHI